MKSLEKQGILNLSDTQAEPSIYPPALGIKTYHPLFRIGNFIRWMRGQPRRPASDKTTTQSQTNQFF
jgi:hypothetical protein